VRAACPILPQAHLLAHQRKNCRVLLAHKPAARGACRVMRRSEHTAHTYPSPVSPDQTRPVRDVATRAAAPKVLVRACITHVEAAILALSTP
jgi:hypothetical protein